MRRSNNRLVHGSTDAALGSRSCLASYAPSPCGHGVSRRQDVLCRVLVSIVVGFAFGAIPFANGQRQFFKDVPTGVAALARREKSIHVLERLSVPLAFVLKHSTNGAKGGIRKTTGQAVVADHAPDVQIFDANHIEMSYERSREFVQVVSPRVRDTSMKLGNAHACAFSALTALDPSCQDSLRPGELSLQLFAMPRIWNSGPVREGCKTVDAEVNSDGLLSLRQLLDLLVEDQGHKVSSCTVLGYRGRGGRACECSGPADFEPAKFGDRQVAVLSIPLEGGPGIFSSLFAVFLLAGGIPGSLLEEVLEGRLEMAKGLLGGDARDFIQPSMVLLFFEPGQCRRRLMVADSLAVLITVSPQAQSPVVDVSTASKNLGKQGLLLRGGVKPESISEPHTLRIAYVSSSIKLSEERRGSNEC